MSTQPTKEVQFEEEAVESRGVEGCGGDAQGVACHRNRGEIVVFVGHASL